MSHLRPTLVFLLLLSLLFGGAYPFVTTEVAQAFFSTQAEGSLIFGKDGKPLGSALIGQNFSKPEYFWGRLSATSPYTYNATSSSGSNFGSNNPALLDAVKGRIAGLKTAGGGATVPADLATASGSGLDPHISPEAAEYQIGRVAQARHVSDVQLRALVQQYTEDRQFGILGEPTVNVLKLNLALDGKL